MIVYHSALIPRKFSSPKKPLAARLIKDSIYYIQTHHLLIFIAHLRLLLITLCPSLAEELSNCPFAENIFNSIVWITCFAVCSRVTAIIFLLSIVSYPAPRKPQDFQPLKRFNWSCVLSLTMFLLIYWFSLDWLLSVSLWFAPPWCYIDFEMKSLSGRCKEEFVFC